MNLLEHWILHVYSVEDIKCDWGSFVKVDMDINCYGREERVTETFSNTDDWITALEKGYYMA